MLDKKVEHIESLISLKSKRGVDGCLGREGCCRDSHACTCQDHVLIPESVYVLGDVGAGTGKHFRCKRAVLHMVRDHSVPHSKLNYVVYLIVYTV